MAEGLMGLGWYMRRTEDAARLAHFYKDVLGLPLLRGAQPVFMFWAGEALVFELKSDEAPVNHRETDPKTAPCVPIFRTSSMDQLLTRLSNAAVEIVTVDSIPGGREAFILDPDHQLIGFRQMDSPCEIAWEEEAKRRKANPVFDPGCSPMPEDIDVLLGVQCRYQDPNPIQAFYKDTVGLELMEGLKDRPTFHLGDNTILEILGGGKVLPMPKDRIEVTNSFILRTAKTDPIKTHLEQHGVPWPNPHIQWKRAHLCYFTDPENHIVGIEERYDPKDYPPGVESYAEDLEAERRYRAGGT